MAILDEGNYKWSLDEVLVKIVLFKELKREDRGNGDYEI